MVNKTLHIITAVAILLGVATAVAAWSLGGEDFGATVDVVRGYLGDTIRGTVGHYKIARAKAVRQITLLEREADRLIGVEARNRVAADTLADDKLPALLAQQAAIQQELLDWADLLEAGQPVERFGRQYNLEDLQAQAMLAQEQYKALLEQIDNIQGAIVIRRQNAQFAYEGRHNAMIARQILLTRLGTVDAQIDRLLALSADGLAGESTADIVATAQETFAAVQQDITTQGHVLAELRQMQLESDSSFVADLTTTSLDQAAELRSLATSR